MVKRSHLLLDKFNETASAVTQLQLDFNFIQAEVSLFNFIDGPHPSNGGQVHLLFTLA
jgi:hypothetical protein